MGFLPALMRAPLSRVGDKIFLHFDRQLWAGVKTITCSAPALFDLQLLPQMFNATLIGRLGKDPELRTTPSGATVCQLNVAETEYWRDSQGERHERTTWVRCAAWGGLGEALAKHLRKGDRVCFTGRPSASAWKTTEGEARASLDFKVDGFEFINDKRQEHTATAAASESPAPMPGKDDDLPF